MFVNSRVEAQAPNWDSVYADYFTKYAPLDTPTWLFPICFKNANSEWDTVYIGYDSSSTINLDSGFGENFIKIDTWS